MSFGVFEAANISENEKAIKRQASVDKFDAAVYDVKAKLGGFLFGASTLQDFRDRVALLKNDQSIYRVIQSSGLHPATGIVRRIVGKNSVLEREFRKRLAAEAHDWYNPYDDNDSALREDSRHLPPVDFRKPVSPKAKDVIKNSQRRSAKGKKQQQQPPLLSIFPQGLGLPGVSTDDLLGAGSGSAPHEDPHIIEEQVVIRPKRHSVNRYAEEQHDRRYDQKVNPIYHPQDGTVDNKGDFHAYEKSVESPAGKNVDSHDFSGPVKYTIEHHDETSDAFAPNDNRDFGKFAMAMNLYGDWCHFNDCNPRKIASLDTYGDHLSDNLYLRMASVIEEWDFTHKPKVHSTDLDKSQKLGAQRTAAPDHLQKANDALTNLLNDKAQDFQKTIEPLQQALTTIQNAAQQEQAANPMSVLPPAGTVNPLPQQQDQAAAGPPVQPTPTPPPGGGDAPTQAPPMPPAGGMQDGPPPGAPDPSQMTASRLAAEAHDWYNPYDDNDTALKEESRHLPPVDFHKPKKDSQRRTSNQYIKHDPGHKNAEGKPAPWVITQKGTGDIISSHTSQEEAEKAFGAMEAHKHGRTKAKIFDDWERSQRRTSKKA